MRGRVSSLLEVGTGFHPELTGRENIYLNGAIMGMRRAEIDAKLDEIIAFSGIEHHIDTPIKRYSVGMKIASGFRGGRAPGSRHPRSWTKCWPWAMPNSRKCLGRCGRRRCRTHRDLR